MHTADIAPPVAPRRADPSRQENALDGTLRALHAPDPLVAQKAASDAISRILKSDPEGPAQLESLLDLDLHAQQISHRLMARYVDGDAQMRSFDLGDWISALRLSKKFYQAYERLLPHTEGLTDPYWLTHAHFVLVKLFHHRQTEFLLRFIRFKKRIPGQWKEIHEAYKFALMRGIAMHSIGSGTVDETEETATTLEQQYIRLLLLEVINNGQFSPRDALWADRWFARWAKYLRLDWHETANGVNISKKGFVVDLDGSDGLKRGAGASPRNPLFLDPAPLQAVFHRELELLRNVDPRDHTMTMAVRAGKITLLNKLRLIYAPVPVKVTRRGEREPVALAIQLITGLPNIIQVLREEARTHAKAAPATELPLEANTFSPLGAATDSPALAAGDGTLPPPLAASNAGSVAQEDWQVRDRSDSGSRLRGQIDDLNRVIPGSLIAIRESVDAPWTVSVVRRFRRLMVNFVELGVEHIGRKPSVVKLVAERSGAVSVDDAGDPSQRGFVALYLPPSERQPVMPIKTLVLPVRKFDSAGKLTLLSSKSSHTLRLGEPIQQQFEYLWTSFTIIDHARASDGVKAAPAMRSQTAHPGSVGASAQEPAP